MIGAGKPSPRLQILKSAVVGDGRDHGRGPSYWEEDCHGCAKRLQDIAVDIEWDFRLCAQPGRNETRIQIWRAKMERVHDQRSFAHERTLMNTPWTRRLRCLLKGHKWRRRTIHGDMMPTVTERHDDRCVRCGKYRDDTQFRYRQEG